MKHFIVCLAMIIGAFAYGAAAAQSSADQGQQSDAIVAKMRQIDLLNQIVPLALTKEQIGKILPAVERARAKVRQIQKDEAVTLSKMDGKVSDAIRKCIESSSPPTKELMNEIAQTTQDMSDRRVSAIAENTIAVLKVFNETCNAGQKKAAAGSFSPQYVNPNVKPDELTQDQKVTFFVREILLDPQAYDILVQLEKHASSGG